MRVFILCTGRCGSTTLIRACEHLTNFEAGHETLIREVGEARFAYPDQHIEADNRLSWFLGELDQRFGTEPYYLHLRRDPERVAQSFLQRADRGIMRAFNGVMVHRTKPAEQLLDVCRFYVRTVTANIELFLRDKPRSRTGWLEDAQEWFPKWWDELGGVGDLSAALREFETHHNAGVPGGGGR